MRSGHTPGDQKLVESAGKRLDSDGSCHSEGGMRDDDDDPGSVVLLLELTTGKSFARDGKVDLSACRAFIAERLMGFRESPKEDWGLLGPHERPKKSGALQLAKATCCWALEKAAAALTSLNPLVVVLLLKNILVFAELVPGFMLGRAVMFAEDVDGSFKVAEWSVPAALLAFLFFLQPPPTGTVLRAPPLVQYLLHVLQKWRG